MYSIESIRDTAGIKGLFPEGTCFEVREINREDLAEGYRVQSGDNVSGYMQRIPVVSMDRNGKYEVIDGRKYIGSVPDRMFLCNVVTPEPSARGSFILRAILNRGRERDISETVQCLESLVRHFNGSEFYAAAEAVGFSKAETNAASFLKEMGDTGREMLKSGFIDLKNAEYLAPLSEEEQKVFYRYLSDLSPSVQNQREFLEWLPEIAYSHGRSLADILRDRRVTEIRENTRLNNPQRLEKIRDVLFRLRFPNYSKALKEWDRAAQRMNPDAKSVRIEKSSSFERREFFIKIKVRDTDVFRDACKRLTRVDEADLKRLMDPFTNLDQEEP